MSTPRTTPELAGATTSPTASTEDLSILSCFVPHVCGGKSGGGPSDSHVSPRAPSTSEHRKLRSSPLVLGNAPQAGVHRSASRLEDALCPVTAGQLEAPSPCHPGCQQNPKNKTLGEHGGTQRGTQQGELSKRRPCRECRPSSRSALMTLKMLQDVCQAACAACDVAMRPCKCATGSRTAPVQKCM